MVESCVALVVISFVFLPCWFKPVCLDLLFALGEELIPDE